MSKRIDTPAKRISRRDAIKLLTAVTGATALANIPPRWSSPDLKVGVLPAHAQTSGMHTILAGPDNTQADYCQALVSTAQIDPPTPGIQLNYAITLSNNSTLLTAPASLTGTIATNATGGTSLTINVDPSSPFNVGDTITVTWSFANPVDGIGSAAQVFISSSKICTKGLVVVAGPDNPEVNFCGSMDSTANVIPNTPGIPLNYAIQLSNINTLLLDPQSLTGTLSTDASGGVSLTIQVSAQQPGIPPANQILIFDVGDTITVTWSFANPGDGTGSDDQVFVAANSGC